MFEPKLLVNKEIAQANIQRMLDKCRLNNVIYRPHFKTHQSAEIGEWYREMGVDCITCSSFKMAQYFADTGWKDITVAISTNEYCVDVINDLASKINLNILVEDIEVLKLLQEKISVPVGVFIKVDAGYNRTGVDVEDFDAIKTLLDVLKDSTTLIFIGFLCHAGDTYEAHGKQEIIDVSLTAMHKFIALKVFLKDVFPLMQLSWGDTPSCSVMDSFVGIDELRPGNMIFYDYMQSLIGSCKLSDIAVCMRASVIAVHAKRNEIVLHCGAIHLSKDSATLPDGTISYGKAVVINNNMWDVTREIGEVISLSQEHAIVKVDDEVIKTIKPGYVLGVLPVHSCLAIASMKELTDVSNSTFKCM